MEIKKSNTRIEVRDVTLAYNGRPVVEKLTFGVTAGMYLCVVGANGSGKSTLMRAITGILHPTAGHIQLADGVTVGYLPQQSEIQRDFPASVWEVALSGCLGRSKHQLRLGFGYDKASRDRAMEMLALLGMDGKRKQPYNTLSGGQQQRVLLARALCASDDILLLDEPVTGLDPDAAREMYALIRQLNEKGTSILMVTHDMEAALEESTHILCLCQRHATEDDRSGHFFGTTQDYRAGLMEDGCSCCGMEHPKSDRFSTGTIARPPLVLPDKTIHPREGGTRV